MDDPAFAPWTRRDHWLWAVTAAATWIFAILSLGPVSMMLYWLWPPGNESRAHIFSTSIEGVSYEGFGIAYQGTAGLALATAQVVAVVGALAMTLHPSALPRRAGHLVLTGWCGLWLANAISFVAIDAYFRSVWLGIAAAIAAFFACTVSFAVRRW